MFGTAEAFYRPAASGLLPQTVPEDEIQEASAATLTFENVAELAGPALATVLVLGFSPAAAFGLDAATFLVSAALLVRVRPRERAAPAPSPTSIRADLVAGFREVRSRTWVWATVACFCAVSFVIGAPLLVVGPLVAEQQYGDLAVFGYVTVALGAGLIAGSLAALRWRPRHPLRSGIALILLWPPAVALYAMGLPLELVVPAMAIGGAGAALFDVAWVTALAEQIPPDKLSRVSSCEWAASLALMPVGYVLAGPAAHALGPTSVLLGGAILATVAIALALVSKVVMARRPPRADEIRHARGVACHRRGLSWCL